MDDTASALQREGLAHRLKQQHDILNAAPERHFSCLTLLLTYRCPASCDHCVFDSSPRNTAKLNVETAERTIAAVSRQQPPPSLSFSGGEPFLELATMKRLASFALERGMVSEVVTSAAWVADAPRTRAVLADLQQRGLRTVCASYDRFHAPYVAAAKLSLLVTVAIELGLRVVLNTMLDPDDRRECSVMLAEALALPIDTIRACFVQPLATVPVGRARNKVANYVYSERPPRGGCQFAGRIVTVSPHGFLYPCCGPVIGEPVGQADLLIQDNLDERSVDEIADIFEDLKNDLFFNLLSTIGPYGLLQQLQKRDPALVLRRYVNQCDACLEFSANPQAAKAARALLEESRAR